MAKTLTDAITQIQTIVGAISGIKQAPIYPPEKMSEFPFAIAFPGAGTITTESAGTKRGLHQISLEIHTARKNMAQDVETVIGYGETVANAILGNLTLNGSVDTVNGISYEFGPLGYDTTPTLGYKFTIDVKIRNTIT